MTLRNIGLWRRLSSPSGAGVADQAIVSVVSFATGVLLMSVVSKSDYGAYILVINASLLFLAIQNALVNSPLMTSLVTRAGRNLQDVAPAASLIQWGLCFVLICGSTLAFIAARKLGYAGGLGWGHFLAGMSYVAGALAREYSRAMCYAQKDSMLALKVDATIGIAVLLMLLLALACDNLSAAVALSIVGIINLVITAVKRGRTVAETVQPTTTWIYWLELWQCGRWALPSVVVAWVFSSAYAYILASGVGAEAVGDIGAARMLMMPLGLLVTAWSNVYRARVGDLFKGRDFAGIQAMLARSIVGVTVIAIVYVAMSYLLFPRINAELLGGRFNGIDTLFLPWAAYFIVLFVRTVGMVAVLSVPIGFELMLRYGVAACAASMPLVYSAAHNGSLQAVVCSLIVGEIVVGALVWGHGWRAVRRSAGPHEQLM